MKVVKFGGSSLANAFGFKQVLDIIKDDPSRRVVVVSAPGKSNTEDAKVTDLLYLLYAHIEYGIDYGGLLNRIKNRFLQIKNDLSLHYDIDAAFKGLEKELSKTISRDYLVSRGEYFQAQLMAEYLGYKFIDSKDLIVIKQSGRVSRSRTSSKCNIEVGNGIVVPGFYGSSVIDGVKLFSRGGSDLSAAVLSNYLGADEFEKWTDVSGIFAADPSIVKDASYIPELTYNELREMSYRGANVLHEDVILAFEDKDITLTIKNTEEINAAGTKIKREVDGNGKIVTSVTGKQHFMTLDITKKSSAAKISVMQEIMQVFTEFGVSIEHIASGLDTYSIIFDPSGVIDELDDFVMSFKDNKYITDVSIAKDFSLVAVVGRNMANIPGIAGRLFSSLGKANINVKTIAQASTELSIIIGIEDKDYIDTVKTIHNEFFE